MIQWNPTSTAPPFPQNWQSKHPIPILKEIFSFMNLGGYIPGFVCNRVSEARMYLGSISVILGIATLVLRSLFKCFQSYDPLQPNVQKCNSRHSFSRKSFSSQDSFLKNKVLSLDATHPLAIQVKIETTFLHHLFCRCLECCHTFFAQKGDLTLIAMGLENMARSCVEHGFYKFSPGWLLAYDSIRFLPPFKKININLYFDRRFYV